MQNTTKLQQHKLSNKALTKKEQSYFKKNKQQSYCKNAKHNKAAAAQFKQQNSDENRTTTPNGKEAAGAARNCSKTADPTHKTTTGDEPNWW
ncbi:hypothetical protein P8452_76156 [Trifolium repens]|nr:hypothetical protein P8452_76156 [Trifolium repens]